MASAPVTVFACGDVMTGRGIDQILPHSGNPGLREPQAGDARDYVRLAERVSGPIPAPADFGWPWGDALAVVDSMAPAVRLINLETSVTSSDAFAPGKRVHYRMSPANLPCVAAIRPDACALANNHVLDFGPPGLAETLAVLTGAGLRIAGAGRDLAEARRPAAIPLPGGGRVLVFSRGSRSSGIPRDWAAAPARPGVCLLPAPPATTGAGSAASTGRATGGAGELAAQLREAKRDGDLAVVSIHWGPNWGYEVSPDEVGLAHALIDAGADLIHGHSSHHPRPVEVYRGKLILYGCGDCVNDYEGIAGHREFRGDLRLLYFASLAPGTGDLESLTMVAMRSRKMRLEHASPADARWLAGTLTEASLPFTAGARCLPDGTLRLHWK
ncbi:MAG TPA: CapA family protein [Trebonia sp.]|nr:CapA family protein [Trebonia sp.]